MKNLLILDTTFEQEVTILLVIIVAIVLAILCLSIIKKIKDK